MSFFRPLLDRRSPRPGSAKPRPLAPPKDLATLLEERSLGAVPLAEDDSSWAVATADHLVITSQEPGEADAESEAEDAGQAEDGQGASATRYPWHEVEHGSWDAQERTFTLRWTDAARPELVLRVPAGVRRQGRYQECDVADFARALRQRVEAAIVHSATTVLPSGTPASASIRRDVQGRLYAITRPAHGQDEADAQALRQLEKWAADGVGLPTG